MKKIFGIIVITAIVAVTGWNYSQSQKEVELSDLALSNVEALAFWEDATDWWESKVYTCQDVAAWEYKCMKYKDIPREDGSWEVDFGQFDPEETVCGYFKAWDTDCVSGNSVAHCWEC